MKKEIKKPVRQGWECQKCGRVNAIWVETCICWEKRNRKWPKLTREEWEQA